MVATSNGRCPYCHSIAYPILACDHCSAAALGAQCIDTPQGEHAVLDAWFGAVPHPQPDAFRRLSLQVAAAANPGTIQWVDASTGKLHSEARPGRAGVVILEACDGCVAARRVELGEDDDPRPAGDRRPAAEQKSRLSILQTAISPLTSVCAETALYAMPEHARRFNPQPACRRASPSGVQ